MMKTKIQESVIGGIIGTAAMTLIMYIAPMMGLPKMNPAAMLSGMLSLPIIVGWMMHFMIGIIFALAYVFLINGFLKKVNSKIFKGVIFGLMVFLFAQIMMVVMNSIFGSMASPDGSMALMMAGSIIGHVVYGVVTLLFVKENA